eukprot:5574106-Amphidinium_carterae.1
MWIKARTERSDVRKPIMIQLKYQRGSNFGEFAPVFFSGSGAWGIDPVMNRGGMEPVSSVIVPTPLLAVK